MMIPAINFTVACTGKFRVSWKSAALENGGGLSNERKSTHQFSLPAPHRKRLNQTSPFCMRLRGRRKMARRGQLLEVCWQDLEGHCADEVLHAPKTSGDPSSTWPPVHVRVVRYLIQNVVGKPWADHLILMAAALSARRLDVASVKHTLYNIHARFADIFPALDLANVAEWNPDTHLAPYMRGDMASDHSQYTRNLFWTRYKSTARLVRGWFDALPEAEQQIYQSFVLPEVNMFLYEELSQSKQIVQQQRAQRKTETEAIVPHFADLREDSHYIFYRLACILQAYLLYIVQVFITRSNLTYY